MAILQEKKAIDYTKYRLKTKEEIQELLGDISELFILWCRKCYKEFESTEEPECEILADILKSSGVTIIGCEPVDFLCNSRNTEKNLKRLPQDVMVGVISCGLGIQFVASRCAVDKRRVLALADSIPQSGNATSIVGYHGIALREKKCAACGQCYLEKTGGICPVVDCAKSLLNGPCGGADEEGMCEVNKKIRCAWLEIYERLKKQGRLFDTTVEIRNYNIFPVDIKKKAEIVNQKERMKAFFGGVHPIEKKEATELKAIEVFPPSERLCVFFSQHTGIPAIPLVKPGERVRKGQKIGEDAGLISSPVHSGISGRVITIEERRHPVFQQPMPAVIIENDGADIIDSSVTPVLGWENLSNDKLIEILRDKGIVGLGGAMFPSSVKLCPPKPVDTLIINGCECEPYLNADNRLMIEYPEEILKGTRVVQRLLCLEKTVFAIEENKEEAIERITRYKERYSEIEVSTLRTKYPQGAEKMLIKSLLDREIPVGKLPFDAGVVVLNVGTIYSIYRAIYEGMPLLERVVTVAGGNIVKSGNFMMKIGTPFYDIARRCFNESAQEIPEGYELKMGGPMMGITQSDYNSAVIKGTTGLLLLERYPVDISEENTCIKCGRCVDVCPVDLLPHYFAYYGKKGMWRQTLDYGVKDCIECSSCQYICSSKINLMSLIKKAKKYADNKG